MKGKAKAVEFAGEQYSIQVIGRHVQVTDAMKDYAIDKISKIERLSDRIIDVIITMDIQKLEHRIDIEVRVNHVKIRTHATTEDMYKSIDIAVDKLKEQVRRYKRRLHDHRARSAGYVDVNVNVVRHYQDPVAEINEDIEEENERSLMAIYRPEVVSREKRPLPTLTVEEAIMRLDLSGDKFLVYRSEEDQKLKVIYWRNDGNFGIIEPEL